MPPLTSTRTHTRYFSDESLAQLDEAITELVDDAAKRGPYITPEAATAMDQRLAILRHARDLLAEPVPTPFGG